MFIKKLFDTDSLLMFDTALQAEIAKGAPQTVKLLIDTLRKMVLNRIPRHACFTRQLERVEKNNQMGDSDEHMMTFTE